ncbi:hypothetical protein [Streptomyces sioyaensis]|uniref:hypothetical protein n=1 Tax=Streptomyces sioyaensis TaxID=67364 RepID=UPI0037246FDE
MTVVFLVAIRWNGFPVHSACESRIRPRVHDAGPLGEGLGMGGFNEAADKWHHCLSTQAQRRSSSVTVLLFPVNLHGPQDRQLLSNPADKRCHLK